jgi:apolipoprotein N-acyltransferase
MRTDGKAAVALDAAIAAGLGAVFSLSFVHTWAWWLQFLCIGLLAWSVSRVCPRRAALIGWAFGTAWIGAGTWWLFISMHRYGELPAALAALAVAALAGALSLYLAAALALFARLRRGRVIGDALLFGAVWLLAELARGVLFTGFPWVATGYGQVDAPLAAWAPWVGVYGIGAIVAVLAAALALGGGAKQRLGAAAAVAAVVFASPLLLQREFTQSAGRIGVTLVQTNVAQNEKFLPQLVPENLAWLQQTLADARGTLVIAPETAIPLLPEQLGDEAWRRFTAPFADAKRALLVGLPLGDYDAGYTNSVAGVSGVSAAGPAFYRYDKHHLVPFGEFIPPGFRWFTNLLNIPLGDFARGPLGQASFAFAGQRIAPNICYEDLFGEELARQWASAETAPTMLANVSNIGWFGDTIAIAQHLNISRARTLEFQAPMLRATNTGATAVIDHRGVVAARLAPFTRGVLDAEVEGRSGATPYVSWVGRFGLWPLALLAALLIAGLGWRRKAAP